MYNLSRATLVALGSISSVFPLSLTATSLEISPVSDGLLVGNINDDIATSQSEDGNYQPFYWQLLSNSSISNNEKLNENEPYLYLSDIDEEFDSVRLCVEKNHTSTTYCSDWYSKTSHGLLKVNNQNAGSLQVDFIDLEKVKIGSYASATAIYNSDGSDLRFSRMVLGIYDQDNERITERPSRFTENSINMLSPISEKSSGIKACAVVTFSSGLTSDQVCTPLYSTAIKERYQAVTIHTGNKTIDTYERKYKNNYVISIIK